MRVGPGSFGFGPGSPPLPDSLHSVIQFIANQEKIVVNILFFAVALLIFYLLTGSCECVRVRGMR